MANVDIDDELGFPENQFNAMQTLITAQRQAEGGNDMYPIGQQPVDPLHPITDSLADQDISRDVK